MGAGLGAEHAAGSGAAENSNRSASAGALSREWAAVEYAAIRGRVRMQRRGRDGASAGQAVSDLVVRRWRRVAKDSPPFQTLSANRQLDKRPSDYSQPRSDDS